MGGGGATVRFVPVVPSAKAGPGCIQRGAGGDRILDVVPRGTELEPLGIRRGVWAGCTHSAVIPTTSL
jgi:hypothetical protein